MNYESANGIFPPGQMKMATKPPWGITLFVCLLPYVEQQPLFNAWNFSYGYDNLYGSTSRSATRIAALLCVRPTSSRPIPCRTAPPRTSGTASPATAATAARRSHPFSAVTNDGIYTYTGPGSTAPGNTQVTIAFITDGLSNTLFYGERNHFDRNYDTFATPRAWTFFSQTMGMWGWWASSSGGYGLSDVAESTFAPINYLVPNPLRQPRRPDVEFRVHDDL